MVVGSVGHVALYDASTTLRLALIPLPGGHTPRLLQMTPSGNHVLIACAEWTIYHLPLKNPKPALVLSLAKVKKKPLDSPLMAFMGAFPDTNRVPVLFVTNRLKDSIRSVYLANRVPPENAKPSTGRAAAASKDVEPGSKLPLEAGKGAVAMAAHPLAPVLYVLTVNGELQMYQHVQGSASLQPLFQFTSAHCPSSFLPPSSPLFLSQRLLL